MESYKTFVLPEFDVGREICRFNSCKSFCTLYLTKIYAHNGWIFNVALLLKLKLSLFLSRQVDKKFKEYLWASSGYAKNNSLDVFLLCFIVGHDVMIQFLREAILFASNFWCRYCTLVLCVCLS